MGVTRRQARRQQTGGGHDQRRPNANNASEPAPKKGTEWHDTSHAKSKRPIHLSKELTRRHRLPDRPGENGNGGGPGAQRKVGQGQTENPDFVRMTHQRKAERCKRSHGASANHERSWPEPCAKTLRAQRTDHSAKTSHAHSHSENSGSESDLARGVENDECHQRVHEKVVHCNEAEERTNVGFVTNVAKALRNLAKNVLLMTTAFHLSMSDSEQASGTQKVTQGIH